MRNCSCQPIWLGSRRADGLTPENVVDRLSCNCCRAPKGIACGNEGTAPGPHDETCRWADVCPTRVANVVNQGTQASLEIPC